MSTFGILLILVGTLVSLLAAWGLIDFPSALSRMHASTKSASLGLALISLGAGFAAESWGLVGIGVLVTVFLFVTSPTSAHLLGRATYAAGQTGDLVHDDLAGVTPTLLDLEAPERRIFSIRRWAMIVVVWMLLWRDVSAGTFVGGALVGLLLESVRRRSERAVRPRPLGLIRFMIHYVGMVFVSNARVAWEVVTPNNDQIREAIVACPLQSESVPVSLLVANAMTYTPGTLTIELADNPRLLYVHVLHFTSAEEVRAQVARLEELVLAAIPERADPRGSVPGKPSPGSQGRG